MDSSSGKEVQLSLEYEVMKPSEKNNILRWKITFEIFCHNAPVNVKPQGRGAGHTSGICHLSLSRGWGIIKHLT